MAAGVKVSCIVSAVADGPKSVRIYPERTSEAKILTLLGPWLRDRILLIDLGYFKYLFFDRIDRGKEIERCSSSLEAGDT